jgi:hypothetical protein
MKILDLDLDFFINDIVHNVSDYDSRVDDNYTSTWLEEHVCSFLESQCKLSKSRPIKGKVVEHHHEAFLYWRELILNGQITTPFEVVHVDAHSDLGLGDASWAYIMGEILHRPFDNRMFPDIEPHKLNPGSYLAFAIACRWVSKITFVLHPKWRNDLTWIHFKDYDTSSGIIQLKKYDPKTLDVLSLEKIKPLELEPEVPFTMVKSSEYTETEQFSFVVLSRSPGYTPKSADKLIDIICRYIK